MRAGHPRRVRPADQSSPRLRYHAVLKPTDTITLVLAGFTVELRRDPNAAPLELPPVCNSFAAQSAATTPVLRCQALPVNASLPDVAPDHIAWQSDHWCLASHGTDWLLALHALPDERRVTVARFANDFSTADIIPRWGRHAAPSAFAWNYPCDQVVVLNCFAPLGVAVVHGGAVAFGDDGLLFVGRSGAGKTTLSRLCRDAGATMLNDDRQFIWVDPASGNALLSPTPWHGSDPEVNHRTVPLRAIFALDQSPHDRLFPLGGVDAAARLLGNTVAPFYFADAMNHILKVCDEITERVPMYRLEFTPTQDAVDLVRSLLR